jgi:hypothetical protein
MNITVVGCHLQQAYYCPDEGRLGRRPLYQEHTNAVVAQHFVGWVISAHSFFSFLAASVLPKMRPSPILQHLRGTKALMDPFDRCCFYIVFK